MPWTPRIASNAQSLQENSQYQSIHTINKEDPETLLCPVSEDQ